MHEDVPVYVMLPLDTVNAQGVFQYVATPWFTDGLALLRNSGVKGVAIDCWWGAVEKSPQKYDFSAYRQVCDMLVRYNLKLQVVLSFHACGVNVNDDVQIPLPQWVRACGANDPDMFYMDSPLSQGGAGRRNDECVSLFADHARCLAGRTPLECYRELMHAFKNALSDMLGTVIEEVVVGMGPCGELRYPAYSQNSGWKFPGIGSFQVYDRRAQASLARAANEAGHSDWGRSVPAGVGHCNSLPHDTSFFNWNGGWQTPQGEFFMDWYSSCLQEHGRSLLRAAVRTFFPFLGPTSQAAIRRHNRVDTSDLVTDPPAMRSSSHGCMEGMAFSMPSPRNDAFSNATAGPSRRTDFVQPSTAPDAHRAFEAEPDRDPERRAAPAFMGVPPTALGAGGRPPGPMARHGSANGVPDLWRGQGHGMGMLGNYGLTDSASNEDELMSEHGAGPRDGGMSGANGIFHTSQSQTGGVVRNGRSASSLAGSQQSLPPRSPLRISVKIAGVHWWYHSPSHAAELTAGYYNTSIRDGYADIVETCAQHGADIILTCVEMSDTQHPPEALCSPEGLLRQVREVAHRHQLQIAGENALPCITESGLNAHALDLIVRNTQSVHILPRRASDVVTCAMAQNHYQSGQCTLHNGMQAPSSTGSCYDNHNIQGPIPLPHSISFSPPAHKYLMHGGLQRSVLRKATSSLDLKGNRCSSGGGGTSGELVSPSSVSALMACGAVANTSIPEGRPQESLALAGDDVDEVEKAAARQVRFTPGVLPAMRMFTFLRLSEAMLQPGPSGQWMHFMSRMQRKGK